MVKLWILSVFVVAALVQVSMARDLAEALNVNIREQLNLYNKFQTEADAAPYVADLKKLIEITEGALKSESVDEKQQAIDNAPSNFGEEFNKWVSTKLEEAQVNADIHNAIEFYNSLVSEHVPHEDEVKKAISDLENILKISDLKEKEEKFLGLPKTFSPDFEKFLKENALPAVNKQLQKTADFFENLLHDRDIKFEKEIEELKAKTTAALDPSVSIDEKNKVLEEVTYSENKELNQFLQKKNIEYA